MAHLQQAEFVAYCRLQYPQNFKDCKVLEVGSLDINGSIRDFFTDCQYIGVDLGEGKGVDLIARGEDLDFANNSFDTVASCECFEHNPEWAKTFENMHRMCKPGGLVFFSCATTGRPEHGTPRTTPADSPFTSLTSEYYRNLTAEDFKDAFSLSTMFSPHQFFVQHTTHDLYFYGIKK
jgi:SAM-dependent methyltransferase